MKIEKKEKYTLIKDEKDNLANFAGYLTGRIEEFKDQNLVIDLLKYDEAELTDLLNFLEVSVIHRRKKRSFVMLNISLSTSEIPNELLIVPTLQEAEDIIAMEEIERDLGF
ncbi:hypothetical protein GCM10009117_01560 [Gangjinia marincola]|uniref:Uncharacterized protein n=1 Tax=Gangjinia marincola TaxID=578463 RepID=A0ABN1MDB4_9FLAO